MTEGDEMKAVTWHGKRDVRVDDVPDPTIQEPNDAIVRITTTAICGSDLHLYEVLGPFMGEGDILGHEPMGIIEEVGSEVTNIRPGDRVVLPFTICCGHCFMCGQGLHSQCETTQVREQGMGASLFGFSKLYGEVPGGQAEFLRVPEAQFAPMKVPEEAEGMPDERFVYLSDVLPTSWQAVEYAGIPQGGSVAVFGLGPIGQMSSRIALHKGARVIAVDFVAERIEMARRHGIEVLDASDHDDVPEALREMTDGRGPDSVIDAVGMEAHGSPATGLAQQVTGALPDRIQDRAERIRGGRGRPPERPLPGHRCGAPGRHDLPHRRIWRTGGPAAHADALRQADPVAYGAGQRQALDRGHHAAADRRQRSLER
jgi:threonine dehydrogenase-like Zn-dependent dehydrogenase